MNFASYSLPRGDLASRGAAIPLRQEIEKSLHTCKRQRIKINFKNVNSISESYADELFGVLVIKYGIDQFFERMELIDVDDFVLASIANVIDRRTRSMSNPS
ncbi:STAS-like domain-containing protein [Acinetobacter sp. B10A]|uniref:STAS-like domain-containing protein n=1 Tax=Acinetobacter baretiae TaxID=2605383 RepID=UPI001B3C64CB|nr:STAS-like domain-containing protein [Acinetobacter baretiae]MBF7686483.1 STAS-like domain-containing protein [Acinetobacter baretiae]